MSTSDPAQVSGPIFDEYQQKIIDHIGSPLRVLAGPGTGKTFSLAHKIKHLLENHKVPSEHIYTLTFTTLAAAQMRERLEKVGIAANKMPWAGTLHSLALGLIKKHPTETGVNSNCRPLSKYEHSVLLKDVIADLAVKGHKVGFKGPYRIENFHKAFLKKKSGAGLPAWVTNAQMTRTYDEFEKRYDEALRFYNGIDWQEVIAKAVELIENVEVVRKSIEKKINYLLVDEYQDLNAQEQQLIKLLAGDATGLTIVGDEDQSIYESFRFASPQGIVDFLTEFPGSTSLPLIYCRRCPPAVIDKALCLIKNNKRRVQDKIILPFNEKKKGFLVTLRHKSKKKEIEWLVDKIKQMYDKGYRHEEFLVIFTEGAVAEDYISALRTAGIPIDVKLRLANPFDSQYFSWFISTLRFLADPDENLVLRQCLDYWASVGGKTIWQLRKIAEAKRCSLWKALEDIASHSDAFKEIMHRKALKELWTYLTNLCAKKTLNDIIATVFNQLPDCRNDPGVIKCHEYIMKFAGKEDAVTVKEIIEDFDRAKESGEFDLKMEAESQGVRIMTMHSAKGLEAPLVFVPALEDDIMPGQVENMEERRRLFYVSLTRAKVGIYLSWAAQRTGREIHIPGRRLLGKQKSRFLSEMGE